MAQTDPNTDPVINVPVCCQVEELSGESSIHLALSHSATDDDNPKRRRLSATPSRRLRSVICTLRPGSLVVHILVVHILVVQYMSSPFWNEI
jgi:hypothetical protein